MIIPIKRILFFFILALAIYLLCKIIYGKNKKTERFSLFFQKPLPEFLLIIGITSFIFSIIPHVLFDDAGFILRYLDNFRDGYFFRYNKTEPAVFGISGFIHGLFCGLLCFFKITTPEQALLVSNFTGFILSSIFLFKIFKLMVKEYYLAIILWLITLCGSKMFLSVSACGLETPLHLTFVLVAIYFLLASKNKWFFLFSAFMIISKLDAIPVVFVLIIFYLIKNKEGVLRSVKLFIIFFLIPLSIGECSIAFIFGSPLPQSAFAKIYYHSHPSDHWFPFLQYFLEGTTQVILLGLFCAIMLLHMIEILAKRKSDLIIHCIFGFSFISIMAMYYFYNPVEKMMWYYAMPEIFMIIQVLYGIVYFSTNYLKGNPKQILQAGLIVSLTSLVGTDVFDGLRWLNKSVRIVENERIRMGEIIGGKSSMEDVLLSAHGFPSRYFKGWVLDGSGLNSKLVTRYKRNMDVIISYLHPDYIVNHATQGNVSVYNKHNYRITDIYRDITTSGSSSWIVLKKNNDDKRYTIRLIENFTSAMIISKKEAPMLMPRSNTVAIYNPDPNSFAIFVSVGLERKEVDWKYTWSTFSNGKENQKHEQIVKAVDLDSKYASRYVDNFKSDITRCDSIVFRSNEKDFKIIEPIFEIVK